MKKLICLIAILMAMPVKAADWAAVQTLSGDKQTRLANCWIRDSQNGIHLAGKCQRVGEVDRNGKEVLNAGLFVAWNAEHGDPAWGLSVGHSVHIGDSLANLTNAFDMADAWKPLGFLDKAVSINGYSGFRPRLSSNVHKNFMWGFGAELSIPFGISDLIKGI